MEGASLVRRIMGATHPAHEARVARLKNELARWENERQKHLRKIEWRNKYLKGDSSPLWAWVATRRTSPGGTGDVASAGAVAPPTSADADTVEEKIHKKPVSP